MRRNMLSGISTTTDGRTALRPWQRGEAGECASGHVGPLDAGQASRSGVRSSQNFTLVQVKALIAAAESCSFSKAAAQLSLSQPALSRCIKKMEDALGVNLFLRSPRGVVLSQAGQAVLPQAKRLVEAYEGTLAFVSERQSGRRGRLRLAADASIGPVIMPQLTGNLQREMKGVELELLAMGSEEAVGQVLSRKAEMGLCGEMQGYSDLRYTPLLQAQLGLIVPPGCVIPQVANSLSDFNDVPLVRLVDYTPVTRTLTRHGVQFPAYFDSPIVFACLSAAFDLMREKKVAAVATGIGASLSQAQGMTFLPLPGLLPYLTVHLISLRQMVHDDYSEKLRELVSESVHQSPWHASVRRLNQGAYGDRSLLPVDAHA